MTDKALAPQPEREADSQHPSKGQPSSSLQSVPLSPQMMAPSRLNNQQLPLAQRQQAALNIQRQLGNRQLTNMIHTNMIQRVVARLGPFEVENYAQLVAIMRLGMVNMRDAMTDVDRNSEEYEQADVWVSNVRDVLPMMQREGDAELSQNAALQAQTYYEDYNTLRRNLISWKQRRIRSELSRAQGIIRRRQTQINSLEPEIAEQMRNAYLTNDTDAITQVVNFSALALDVGLSLQGLSHDLSSAISSVRGTSIPDVGRYVGILNRFNRVLATVNLLVSYQDSDAAPTEIGQAMSQINNLTTAFGTATTLFSLAPHIGLYCNLYLGPAVQIATARAQQIIQIYSRQWSQYSIAVGEDPNMSQEPGGGPMFNFLMQVMYASGAADVPTVPENVREYLLNHREMLDIGADEEMPTTGYWFWRNVDSQRIKAWVFSHRQQLWSMFYGNLPLPPAGTRSTH